jgi:phosphoglycerol transferase MdoB-like AlkP superfamily enzyme
MHGGIQKAELNHCFFMGGDKFRTATKVETPSGHIDLAPTILNLLGMEADFLMPGRALSEAMIDGGTAPELDTLTHQMGKDGYQQEVIISRVAGAKLPYLRYGARTR